MLPGNYPAATAGRAEEPIPAGSLDASLFSTLSLFPTHQLITILPLLSSFLHFFFSLISFPFFSFSLSCSVLFCYLCSPQLQLFLLISFTFFAFSCISLFCSLVWIFFSSSFILSSPFLCFILSFFLPPFLQCHLCYFFVTRQTCSSFRLVDSCSFVKSLVVVSLLPNHMKRSTAAVWLLHCCVIGDRSWPGSPLLLSSFFPGSFRRHCSRWRFDYRADVPIYRPWCPSALYRVSIK